MWWGRNDLRPADSRGIAARHYPFGDTQLCQLLNDRPGMKGILRTQDFIYQWVTQEFGSGNSANRVRWEAHEPLSGRPAEHVRAYAGLPATISITADDKISARDKWAMLVYEFHNLKHTPRFIQLERLAATGEINRDRFALECFSAEFQAMVETQQFFWRHPIPGDASIHDRFYLWYFFGSFDFDQYIKMLDAQSPEQYDPRRYFTRYFDEIRDESDNPAKSWWDRLLGR
jgi:hypothetical protein